MTGGTEDVTGDPAAGSRVVMHGQAHGDSTFKQTGVEVNIKLPPVPAAPEVRYSLPPDTVAFTGRDEELGQVAAAAGAAGTGGVVAVRAIDGMPGVGKTALAIHAAHALRDQFPDRQLFIDLHAHTPEREPVRPEDALAGLLTAARVDPRFLPGDLDGRAGMWRDKMAGQRALLVFDNATSTSQVAPLLPGTSGCLVLVTSRRHLGDLPGSVTPVLLDVLPPQQAQEMFIRLAPRAAGDLGGVAEVVGLAGSLPLAISLLARLFARHGSWTLADLTAEIRESLLTLTAENASIGAAFEMSYRHLAPSRQRFFRLLSLHPGTTIDAYAAAALAEGSLEEVSGLLDELHQEGLLTETGHRRYGMHDLLRRYAREHAAAEAEDAQRPVERLVDYYQHTAARAGARLDRQTRPGPSPGAPAGLTAAPDLEDDGQALAWARTDRANMLACLEHAAAAGQHARVIAMTAALAGLLRHDGPWADAVARHAAAVQAARRLGDRLGQANALSSLGNIRQVTDDYPTAIRSQEQALDIYRDIGDRPGHATALTQLGMVRRLTGDFPAAIQALEQALDIYRQIGDRPGHATALTQLGMVTRLTGDYPAATQALEQALDISREIGSRLGQANALTQLGAVWRLTADYPAASQAHELALDIYRELGSRLSEANALVHLGVVQQLTADYPAATQALEQALGIYRDIGQRAGEAEALNNRGTLYRLSGDLSRSEMCHQQALELARAIASSWDEAHALAGLGRCAMTDGHAMQAKVLLRQALEIFQRIGAAEAGYDRSC
jgi:tetratricopeptide (TPR) repeat protein